MRTTTDPMSQKSTAIDGTSVLTSPVHNSSIIEAKGADALGPNDTMDAGNDVTPA